MNYDFSKPVEMVQASGSPFIITPITNNAKKTI
jgi:hypothetical protein